MRRTPIFRQSPSPWSIFLPRLTLLILCAGAASPAIALAEPGGEVTAEVREVVPVWSQSSLDVPIGQRQMFPIVDGDLDRALEGLTERIRMLIEAHLEVGTDAPKEFPVDDLAANGHRYEQVAFIELGLARHTLKVVAGEKFGFGLLDPGMEYAVQPIVGCLQCEARLLEFQDGEWEARHPNGQTDATIRCASGHTDGARVRVTSRSRRIGPEALRVMEERLNQALGGEPGETRSRSLPAPVRLVVDLEVIAP